MLLRRVIEHVKAQNWTAVGLDFVIVVVGVFIGIQVSNWNDARGDRAKEQLYLERLHDELVEQNVTRARFKERDEDLMSRLYAARRQLFGLDEPRLLTDAECRAIVLSNNSATPSLLLPVISELESTGQLDLIVDEDVRIAVSRLSQREIQLRDALTITAGQSAQLLFDFPELITYRLDVDPSPDDEDGLRNAYDCDLDAMRQSADFLNRFGENVTIYVYNFRESYAMSEPALANLHAALDEALGLSHEETTE